MAEDPANRTRKKFLLSQWNWIFIEGICRIGNQGGKYANDRSREDAPKIEPLIFVKNLEKRKNEIKKVFM